MKFPHRVNTDLKWSHTLIASSRWIISLLCWQVVPKKRHWQKKKKKKEKKEGNFAISWMSGKQSQCHHISNWVVQLKREASDQVEEKSFNFATNRIFLFFLPSSNIPKRVNSYELKIVLFLQGIHSTVEMT